jgi:hypothetical protein
MPTVQSDGGPLGAWLEPSAAALGRPAWRRALVLVAGAVLAPGRRTVASALRASALRASALRASALRASALRASALRASALRAAGLGNAPGFAGYHRLPPAAERGPLESGLSLAPGGS